MKIGFIVEGESEAVLIGSEMFQEWCRTIGVIICSPIINARGGGNLLPEYLDHYIARFASNKPDKIAILTDLEEAGSVEEVRNRIENKRSRRKKGFPIDIVFVSVKALEAWFLADDHAMSNWLKEKFHEDHPERTPKMPWDRLVEIAGKKGKPGPGSSHPLFVKTMLRHDFSIERAGSHAHCPSAAEFRDTLKYWGGFVAIGELFFRFDDRIGLGPFNTHGAATS